MIEKHLVYPVLLCGGSGQRLWPLSRKNYPKQFLFFDDDFSLFQSAFIRSINLSPTSIEVGKTLIVCSEDHQFLIRDQLKDLANFSAQLLLEPIAKNTAPALTIAALEAVEKGLDPILFATPTDQAIQGAVEFQNAASKAIHSASENNIVIMGIRPTKPDVSLGYIKINSNSGPDLANVEHFVEKPSMSLAESYLNSGSYFWNSGIVVIRASLWLRAIQYFDNNLYQCARNAFLDKTVEGNFTKMKLEKYSLIPNDSIDYSVIEKCPNSSFSLKMIELDSEWSDLGTWNSIWDISAKDSYGNSAKGDVLSYKSHNNFISSSGRLVALIDVNDLAIIETPDAILVSNRKNNLDVKFVVEDLLKNKREEVFAHRKIMRPWGWFDLIDSGDQFKVKRIQVNPGSSLSLQRHAMRSEHWVVVKGTAKVECGNKIIMLHENESTYIPLGEVHRLSNPGDKVLEIIEVQSGVILSEDDIERIDDNYGRK